MQKVSHFLRTARCLARMMCGQAHRRGRSSNPIPVKTGTGGLGEAGLGPHTSGLLSAHAGRDGTQEIAPTVATMQQRTGGLADVRRSYPIGDWPEQSLFQPSRLSYLVRPAPERRCGSRAYTPPLARPPGTLR